LLKKRVKLLIETIEKLDYLVKNKPGATAASKPDIKKAAEVQIITTTLQSGRYEPIIVQKDIPVKWSIQAQKNSINGCNNEIVILKYNKEKSLRQVTMS